jgi:hypothetical protein
MNLGIWERGPLPWSCLKYLFPGQELCLAAGSALDSGISPLWVSAHLITTVDRFCFLKSHHQVSRNGNSCL